YNVTNPSSRSKKTKVLRRTEVINAILDIFSNANHRIDVCGNSNFPLKISSFESVKKVVIAAKNRGIGLRFIIEITKENLQYCKDLMRITDELRHMDEIEANFGLSETEYLGSITLQEEVLQATYSNVKEVVEQQQYIFDTFWRKAIPADQKIREIEEGIEPEIIETIRDPVEIQMLGFELVKSATYEILVIFSTANAFHRQERAGTMELFKEAAAAEGRRIKIRILTPMDDIIKEKAQKFKEEQQHQHHHHPQIDIRNIEYPLQTKVTILLVDRKFSLAVELKDDTKETSYEAIGLATYSNSKPTVLSYVTIFDTLWKQVDLYGELRDLYEQLKIHDKMQKEFINIAAHELRTPIQPILGLAEVLSSKTGRIEQYNELIDAIIRNAKRLQRLTEDILDVTKIESNSLILNKQQFNLNDIITNTINDIIVKKDFNSENVKILYEPITNNKQDNNNIFVQADRSRLTQVISNLLSNAVKFTKKGTIRVTTQIKEEEEEQDDQNDYRDSDNYGGNKVVVISIKDTGSGISPEIFPRLFSKFASNSFEGTGLGLFIAKSIVEAHGGKIWAENNADGKGATFSFSIPITSIQQANIKLVDSYDIKQ
ncbi:MAG: HAMP domain-containing histidine kinase, partial [Thermoproteota archaeon]|nr:HAMP domain-containing histidine kinase [Thermoproteota archaeon]